MKVKNSKVLKIIGCGLLSCVLMVNCKSVNTMSNESPGRVDSQVETTGNYDEALDLTGHLAKVSGIKVIGQGPNAQITVRGGQNSFQLSPAPLFVLNDTPQTGGYAALYGLVDVETIVSIKVLKGADAAWYGSRGNNGVIVIRTR